MLHALTRVRVAPTLQIVGLIVIVALGGVGFRKLMKRIDGVTVEVNSARGEFRESIQQLGNLGLALAETPDGLELVPAQLGVSRDDLDFLKRYRGPLIDVTDLSGESTDAMHAIGARLRTGFAANRYELLNLGLTERQALVAYALLRVNGSIPTYEVRTALPDKFDELLLETSGNCSDYAVRLMVALESIGVHSAFISNVSTNLPGHVFVDAFDPEEETSYLLDANFNVMIVDNEGESDGMIASLLRKSSSEREEFSETAKIYVFPVYFRFVDPGPFAFNDRAVTRDHMNENRHYRRRIWRRWLADDIDQLSSWWKDAPGHRPRTLKELNEVAIADIPSCFEISGTFAAQIRECAGLGAE